MLFHEIIPERLLKQAVAELVEAIDASTNSLLLLKKKCRLLSKAWKKVDFVPMRVYTLIVKEVEIWRIRLILLSIVSKSIKVLNA